MSGRKKRQWLKLSEHERQGQLLLAKAERISERRIKLRDDHYPESEAVHGWNYRGTECTIVKCVWFEERFEMLKARGIDQLVPFMVKDLKAKFGNLQGYARFPKRPLHEKTFHGIVTYVPAPGGITFAHQYADGSFVYGYDTDHIEQHGLRYKEVNWHVAQVERMVDALIIAKRLERAYRLAGTQGAKITVLNEFVRRICFRSRQAYDITDNFGLMMSLLTGHV